MSVDVREIEINGYMTTMVSGPPGSGKMKEMFRLANTQRKVVFLNSEFPEAQIYANVPHAKVVDVSTWNDVDREIRDASPGTHLFVAHCSYLSSLDGGTQTASDRAMKAAKHAAERGVSTVFGVQTRPNLVSRSSDSVAAP